MKILISGAGITGNSLAFWLSKVGHDITVVERYPDIRASGLQIDLRGHGIEVLRRMGLEQAFRAHAASEQGLQIVDKTGKRRAFFPVNKPGKGSQNFTSEFEIMRGDFCQLLYDAAKDRTKYVFGTSVESFEDNGSSVAVKFADGKTDQFDLVIGADGQGSRTRKKMLGSETKDAFYPIKGLYIAYFTAPRPIQKGEEYVATIYMGQGNRGVMTRRHSPTEIQVYIGGRNDSDRLWSAPKRDVQEQKKIVTELMQGAGWVVDELLEALKDSKDFYCEQLGIVKLDSWFRGRVALVGDAAYCPSPNTGMGTTSGVVGAYILAGEIQRHCGTSDGKNDGKQETRSEDLAKALNAYDTKFRPFMNYVQKGVLEDDGGLPSSSFGITIFYWLAALAAFLKVNVGKMMMKENVKGWTLPEYKELSESLA